jgi:hypothetical protein
MQLVQNQLILTKCITVSLKPTYFNHIHFNQSKTNLFLSKYIPVSPKPISFNQIHSSQSKTNFFPSFLSHVLYLASLLFTSGLRTIQFLFSPCMHQETFTQTYGKQRCQVLLCLFCFCVWLTVSFNHNPDLTKKRGKGHHKSSYLFRHLSWQPY